MMLLLIFVKQSQQREMHRHI